MDVIPAEDTSEGEASRQSNTAQGSVEPIKESCGDSRRGGKLKEQLMGVNVNLIVVLGSHTDGSRRGW